MWATSCAAADEAHAVGADLPRTEDQQEAPRAQAISVSSEGLTHHPDQPGLVCSHQLHSNAPRVSLPRCHHGLAQPEGAELAAVEQHGRGILRRGFERSVGRIRQPGDIHTDQGSQFTSTDFTDVLRDAKIKISMDGRGRWIDNRMIERLWRSVKYECVYLNAFETGSEARDGIRDWISYYNERRPHSSHGIMTPDEAYDRQSPDLKVAA